MLKFTHLEPAAAIKPTHRNTRVLKSDFEAFQAATHKLLTQLNVEESEEHNKTHLRDFLVSTGYGSFEVNTSARKDLVVHTEASSKSPLGILFEVKRPSNTAEMINTADLNRKALWEAVRYYLEESLDKKNSLLGHVIVTNVQEWFVFDAQQFESLFAQNKEVKNQYRAWADGATTDSKTQAFDRFLQSFIAQQDAELAGTYLDLCNYAQDVASIPTEASTKRLLDVIRLLSPRHLLKQRVELEPNSLNRGFYNELLHLIGLEEDDDTRKIRRKKQGERHTGSMLEQVLAKAETQGKLNNLPNLDKYGETSEEQAFAVGLELVLTWVNRLLFLKLLEGQLVRYHNGDKEFRFLSPEAVGEWDELYSLFFQVLAKPEPERAPDVQAKYNRIPYLNSSLFEVSELESKIFSIDALNSSKTLPVFPHSLVRAKDGEKLEDGASLPLLEYLLGFLAAYDFGAEDATKLAEKESPLITASVLGLVFEKINGYKDGSHYTPSAVTMYMARRTLRPAVVRKLNEHFGWDCADFTELVNRLDTKHYAKAIAALESLRVVDPAVGSGHFLVSCLNELMLIRHELGLLVDNEGKRLKGYDFVIDQDELVITEEGGELNTYGYTCTYAAKGTGWERKVAKEKTRVNQTLFHAKQRIIETSLFGVDLNPNSVRICRLRLWIELLKHAYYTPESHFSALQVLPNIDINVAEGDSVVSRYGIRGKGTELEKHKGIKNLLDEYIAAFREYSTATLGKRKEQLRSLMQGHRDSLAGILDSFDFVATKRKKLLQVVGKLKLELADGGKLFELTEKQRKEKQKELALHEKELNRMLADVDKTKQLYQRAFEWRFYFPQVLHPDTGAFLGFDVVIGNPPFLGIPKGVYRETVTSRYPAANGNCDFFAAFMDLSTQITSDSGIIGWITPVSWLTAESFQVLRERLLSANKVEEVMILPYDVFEGIYIDTQICFLNKLGGNNTIRLVKLPIRMKLEHNSLFDTKFESIDYQLIMNREKLEVFAKPMLYKLLKKVEGGTKRLEDITTSYRGILANPTDVSDTSAKGLLPFFSGDVYRYQINQSFRYVKYGDNLRERPRDKTIFEGERILVRRLVNRRFRIMACAVNEDFVTKKDLYVFKIQDNRLSIWYVLALLNSRLFSYLRVISSATASKDDFGQLTLAELRDLPIPIADISIQNSLGDLAKARQAEGLDGRKSEELDKKLDAMVYSLFSLTKAEVEEVESTILGV